MRTYRAAVIGCSRMAHLLITKSPITKRLSYLIPTLQVFSPKNEPTLLPVLIYVQKSWNILETDTVSQKRINTLIIVKCLKKSSLISSVSPHNQEHRAEIVIYAAEHGVKAIYAEKAMAASMDEAAAMVSAVEGNNVAFNLGTNRRWHTGFDKMKEIIDSGEIGKLRTLIIYSNGTLFNSASHHLDLILRLNSDAAASWITGYLPQGDSVF